MSTIIYDIFHNIDARWMRAYEPTDRLIEGWSGRFDNRDIDDVNSACDVIFAMHNRDDRPDGQLAPSLSVGDVVKLWLNGRYDMRSVDNFGWKRVPVFTDALVHAGPYRDVERALRSKS